MKTLSPRWCEQFDLRMKSAHMLDISVWDYDVTGRDDFMGRLAVDEKSHMPYMNKGNLTFDNAS